MIHRRGEFADLSLLLAEHGVLGPRLGEQPPQLGLDLTVGFRDGSQVGFRLDRELRAEVGERDCVGSVGQREGQLEVGSHVPDHSCSRGASSGS